MCGLYGVLNFDKKGLWNTELSTFRDMIIASSVRGTDGTGIIYAGDSDSGICKQGKMYGTVKAPINGTNFLESGVFKKHEDNIKNSRFLLGHNRLATRGTQIYHNTHPFTEDNIILLHNGTITGIDSFPDFKKFQVDSQAIAASLASHEDPKDTLEAIDGAAALVWYDINTATVNLWRNYQRSLAIVKSGNTIFFASEARMLYWLLERNKIPVIGGTILELPTETLFTWNHENIEASIKEIRRNYVKKSSEKEPEPSILSLVGEEKEKKEDSGSPNPVVWEGVPEYFGLRVGDIVEWVPEKINWFQGSTFCKLSGKYWNTIGGPPPKNTMILQDLEIIHQGKMDEADAQTFFEADFLQGTVVGIRINPSKAGDVKVFVKEVGPIHCAEVKNETKVAAV